MELFLSLDKKETLLQIKDKVLKDLEYNFKSSDEKIKTAMSEVFVDELNKSDEKLSEIVKGIENHLIAQDDQLSQISKHLKEIDITQSTADGSKKDWKQLQVIEDRKNIPGINETTGNDNTINSTFA